MPRVLGIVAKSLLWLALGGGAAALIWWWRQEPPVTVRTAPVESGPVEQLVVNTRAGTVKACLRSRLSLALGGLVSQIHVREGDRVQSGDLLIELWNQDLRAQLQKAEAIARRAVLEQKQICIMARQDKREAERLRKLEKRDLTSDEIVERAASNAEASAVACQAAEVTLKEAQATVSVQRALLEKTRLRAPFAGVVADVSLELGEFSTPSPTGVQTPPLVDLLTNDCYYVTAPIDEVDASFVRLNQPVRVTLDAWRGHTLMGKVRRIGNYVQDFESQARTVEIEVELEEVGEVIPLAGYSADVEIIVDEVTTTLRIPSEAVLAEQSVLVLPANGGVLERRQIETGLANWHFTEVTGGLKDGEKVVLSLGEEGVQAGVRANSP